MSVWVKILSLGLAQGRSLDRVATDRCRTSIGLLLAMSLAMPGCIGSRTTSAKVIADPIPAEVVGLPSGSVSTAPMRCIQSEVTGAGAPKGPRFVTSVGFLDRQGAGIRVLEGGIRNDRSVPIHLFVDVDLVSGGQRYTGWAFGAESTPDPHRFPMTIEPGKQWNGTYPVSSYRSLRNLYQREGLTSCLVRISEATPEEVEEGRIIP